MKLRTKLTFSTLIIWGLRFTATYWGAQKILKDSYLELEQRDALYNLQRIEQAIQQRVNATYVMVQGWAIWTETYQFIQDKNEKYINANLTTASLNMTHFDFLAFFNTAHQLVWGGMMNPEHTTIGALPNVLVNDYLNPKSALVDMPKKNSHTYGLVSSDDLIFFVAAHSIVNSDGSGSPRGSIIAGDFFSPQRLDEIKKLTELDFKIILLNNIKRYPELAQIEQTLLRSSGPYIERNVNSLICYTLLHDIYNKPIAIIKLDIPRSLFNVGLATIHYFNMAFFFVAIFFTVLLLMIFRFLITKRLERLNKRVIEIVDKKEFSLRLPEEGSDELGSVSQETNKMLDTIESYNREQKKLLDKVTALLEKVTDDEDFLKHVINAMPSQLIILDSQLKITQLNKSAEDNMGLSNKKSVGLSIDDVLLYLKPYIKKIEASLTSNTPQIINQVLSINEDRKNYYDILIYPFQRRSDHIIVLRIDDVSDRVKIEEKMSQNEKLASLGVLTAGVAHEINNPINFITSRISPLENDLQDILLVLNKYSELNFDEPLNAQLEQINRLKEEMDLTYTIDEIQRMIGGLKEGATRTAVIVKDLRNFSRLDEDMMKKANVEEGIDSTLTLLKHRSLNKIEFIKEYGHVPEIECYPGKLNQVFMNILSNAIDAIPDKGQIRIVTEQTNDQVIIRIKDSGTGIPDDIKSKIFEPFFTTKDVGYGTGLGLSISFGIVRDHGGEIEVKSDGVNGTEFIITVPINHPVTK